MSVKRIVDTSFWTDTKVVDSYSPEDKYFMLYLLTNPHTTQLGIYLLPKKFMAFELGYSLDTIITLVERFQNRYKSIIYSESTQEVSLVNYLKHSIIKGGKPVEDLLVKEINKVKDDGLILETYKNLGHHWSISIKPFDETIKRIFDTEMKKRSLSFNDNDNDNDNEESYPDSYHDSYDDSSERMDYKAITDKYHVICFGLARVRELTPSRKKALKAWGDIDEMTEVFEKVGKSRFLNGDNDRKWKADFDWIIKPANRVKILEGKYSKDDQLEEPQRKYKVLS